MSRSFCLLLSPALNKSGFALMLLCGAFSLLSSCKSKQKVKSVTESKTLSYKSPAELLTGLKKNEFNYTWLSSKFSSSVSIDSNKTSFNVVFKAKKDSVLWFSISPALGIEVARAIITKDSVKFINRLNSTYFKGDFNYISRLLQTDLDFELIQSLLIGNSVAFYEEEENLRSSIDNNTYLLSTIRKRKLRKVIEKNKELKDPAQVIWLEPETYKILRILFKDFNTNRSFEALYSNFQKADTLLFPNNITFEIKAAKHLFITVEYAKIITDKPQSFPFSIPEKYEPIMYKEP